MLSVLLLQCIATFTIVSITGSSVKWLPNSSFKLPENFKDGKLPCSKQTVVFPQMIIGSIKIAAETEVKGFVLPEEGEIILDDLIFGGNPSDNNCTDGNAYYVDKSSASWNQADVWSSPRFSDATPDSDRIPCFNDIVEFGTDDKITVTLPKETQHVKAFYIGNVSYTTEELKQRAVSQSNERQQFILNEFSNTGVAIGVSMSCTKFGCPCQVNPMKIDCSVKFCPKLDCVDPIKPLGFCCEICGGSVLFDADKGFDMEAFDKLVREYTEDKHVYYIGFAPENPVRRIQLVVTDIGGYKGSSPGIASNINYNMEAHWFKGTNVLKMSGSPLDKAGLGWKIVLSMFFAVMGMFVGFYIYYYKLPDFRYPVFVRGSLSRFQFRSDSIVSLTRRDSVISSARGATAFRNPMYDSKRGRVQVVDTTVDE